MRTLLNLVVFALLLPALPALAAAHFLILKDAPLLLTRDAPTPEDIAFAQHFSREVRRADFDEASDGVLRLTAEEANALARMAARFAPGLRARVEIRDGQVTALASAPAPWIGGRRWLNVEVAVPEFDEAPRLAAVRLGGLSLPPGLALEVGRVALNALAGANMGDKLLTSVRDMRISGDNVRFALARGADSWGVAMYNYLDLMRGATMPGRDEIDRHYIMIREAMDRGELPAGGSVTPYLRFILRAALERGTGDAANDYTAAIFGLANVCGADRLPLVVGALYTDLPGASRPWRIDCERVTLRGRVDTKRHFITAAAIQAASNRGFSIPIGEFKELYDSMSEKGGFDFTDIAANNSGIRLSNAVMGGGAESLAVAGDIIADEDDFMIGLAGVPGLMSPGEFRARYGDIESDRYWKTFDMIEARIDRLPIHRAPER